MIQAVFETEDSNGVIQVKLGQVAGSERLMLEGPLWTLLQCSRQEVIKNQFRGYSDKWGSSGCIDYSFGYKRINNNKETVQISFS